MSLNQSRVIAALSVRPSGASGRPSVQSSHFTQFAAGSFIPQTIAFNNWQQTDRRRTDSLQWWWNCSWSWRSCCLQRLITVFRTDTINDRSSFRSIRKRWMFSIKPDSSIREYCCHFHAVTACKSNFTGRKKYPCRPKPTFNCRSSIPAKTSVSQDMTQFLFAFKVLLNKIVCILR